MSVQRNPFIAKNQTLGFYQSIYFAYWALGITFAYWALGITSSYSNIYPTAFTKIITMFYLNHSGVRR